MTTRIQVGLEPEVHQRARMRAAELGLSLAEYVRRLVTADLDVPFPDADVSVMFDLCDSGGSDIACGKANYLTDALLQHRASWH